MRCIPYTGPIRVLVQYYEKVIVKSPLYAYVMAYTCYTRTGPHDIKIKEEASIISYEIHTQGVKFNLQQPTPSDFLTTKECPKNKQKNATPLTPDGPPLERRLMKPTKKAAIHPFVSEAEMWPNSCEEGADDPTK